MTDNQPGAMMRFWLANTLKELREQANITHEEVVVRSDHAIRTSQLSRFESHKSWPRDFDRVVAGYAAALGMPDCRELWQLALDRWRQYGTLLQATDTGRSAWRTDSQHNSRMRFAELIAIQAERDRARARQAQRETSTAKRKRRASG